VLANHGVNIADLRSDALPSPSGASLYRMAIAAEVPEAVRIEELRKALEEAASSIDVDLSLELGGSGR
jgi:glycine cleavage system regulatory protein